MRPTAPPTPRSDLTLSVIDTEAEAEAIATEWRELATACGAGPFARPLYALTWWHHLGSGSLRVVTARREGRLVGLAPLHVRRIGPVRVVRWLGHGLGTVAEAIVHPDHDDVAAALWRAATPTGGVLQLVECREGRPLPGTDGSGAGSVTVAARDTCPVVDVAGDAEAHLADPARKRVRRTVRVSRRRLEEAGLPFTTRVADDAAALASLLPDIRRVFDAAEAAQPRQHLLAGEWESFTTAVLREGVAAGEVLVIVGYAGPDPVAFDIMFVSPTTLSSWIGRFDPEAARYSPGHLVQCAGLDWAAAHGIAHIDLLLGDSFYKRLWAERSYETLEVEAGSRLSRQVLHAAERLRTAVRG